MPIICHTRNSAHPASFFAGALSVKFLPSIQFREGELTEKEARQAEVMRSLAFNSLIAIAERMNEKNESFTVAYYAIKNSNKEASHGYS